MNKERQLACIKCPDIICVNTSDGKGRVLMVVGNPELNVKREKIKDCPRRKKVGVRI